MGSSTSERVERSEAQQVLGFAGIGQGLLDVGWMGGVVSLAALKRFTWMSRAAATLSRITA
jgi:hypothetical protein